MIGLTKIITKIVQALTLNSNEGTHRIVRGASWRGLKDDSRVFYREVLPPIIPPMESIMDCVLY
jgi:hypothetical protein